MTRQTVIKYNLKPLDGFEEEMKKYRARVGILGSHAARNSGEPIDNPTLGMIQMFGSLTRNIPARDFLLMPIMYNATNITRDIGKANLIRKLISAGEYKKVYDAVGAIALKYVLLAFETSGFGQWAPNAPATIRRKKSDRPLIDTSQLRRAQTNDTVNASDIL